MLETSPQIPTAGGTKRTVAVILAGFCAFLQIYAPQPLLPYFTRVFAASEHRVSLMLSLASLGVAIGAPAVGLLSDRLGRRRIIVLSAFLLGMVSLAAATSQSLNQLLFWRFLQGLVTPGVFSTTITYITEEWKTGSGAAVSAYVSYQLLQRNAKQEVLRNAGLMMEASVKQVLMPSCGRRNGPLRGTWHTTCLTNSSSRGWGARDRR